MRERSEKEQATEVSETVGTNIDSGIPDSAARLSATANRQAFRATLALSTPVAAVFLVGALADRIFPAAMVAGFGVIVVSVYFLCRHHFASLAAICRNLQDRASAVDPEDTMRIRDQTLTSLDDEGLPGTIVTALARADRNVLSHITTLQGLSDLRAMVIESIPDAMMVIDVRNRISNANEAARRQFGEQILDRDLSTVIRHPDILSEVKSARSRGTRGEVEIAVAAPVERVFNVRVEPLHDREDGFVSDDQSDETTDSMVIMLFIDLSAIRRAEQMRVDFVANVSHELRTPLATLLGFIETLQGPAKSDEDARERFLDIMREQATRMSRLVQDLLSLSRIEINEHRPPTGHVDLGPVLEKVKAMLDLEARRKDMRIEIKLETDLPMVSGDEDELSQVVQNLMDNAVKYGRPGTDVTAVVQRAESVPAAYPSPETESIVLTVQDRGDGIQAEHIPRLTERFYRVDAARSRELGGTGLGLAIVKHIVSRHRGALGIESKPGEGSQFQIYLPIAPPASAGRTMTAA